MSETLAVHVNRESPQTIDAEVGTIESIGSFTIVVRNHGRPIHVHVHLDDTLSSVAHLQSSNHYVDGNSKIEIPVIVDGDRRPVSGKLKIVTGYGSQTEYVDVNLVEPEETERYVDVDETLSKPQARPSESETGAFGEDNPLVQNGPIAALGGFALLLAVAVASTTGSTTVLFGVLAVLLGVGIAAFLLVVR